MQLGHFLGRGTRSAERDVTTHGQRQLFEVSSRSVEVVFHVGECFKHATAPVTGSHAEGGERASVYSNGSVPPMANRVGATSAEVKALGTG